MLKSEDPPKGVAKRKADQAFDEIVDLIVSYLSSPNPREPDPPCRVGPCDSCGKDDCHVIVSPWSVPLIYTDKGARLTGGLCCAIKGTGKEATFDGSKTGGCAHPMLKRETDDGGPPMPLQDQKPK
jgi:hypothetical protein